MTDKKGKATTSKAQKSIISYMKRAKDKPLVSDKSDQEEESDLELATDAKKDKPYGIVASSLPPINHIPSIFADIVARTPKIKDVAKRLHGRRLRVATMCSGTESPLLALDLICRSVREEYGDSIEVEHVFSCEIEPFKQAYIERNFRPPILFRDVCELGNTHATTAYGAQVEVPGNVDLLVAGTSCVDYSNLNNEKQDLDADGESGRTFRGMMSWVKNHRPPIVILENVCSAPWDKVIRYFEKSGYSAKQARFDTKNYYIPHTRMRGYLIAVDKKHSEIPKEWLDMMPNMRRPASSTLDAFLLPSDDPRIHQAREKLVRESYNGPQRRTGRIDWGRCESRHQRARVEEELGAKRPLTSWDEGGSCKMPDFAWGDWATGQVERVWDLMDISLLRSAIKGIDPSFKTQVWNLSQNVDRSTSSSKAGICPCLTPSMIPYITNRGGPMVGLEALSLQGLPIDELLLTRESEDNLADLAGNAMSTTVVGTCIIASLILCKSLLKPGIADDDVMDVDSSGNVERRLLLSEGRITGEDQLVVQSLDLSSAEQSSMVHILDLAERSARLCECEGRKDITNRLLRRCVDCGSSSCIKCGGRPEHNMTLLNFTDGTPQRILPSIFEKKLKSTLPMCLDLTGVRKQLLDTLWNSNKHSDTEESGWPKWRDAVVNAASSEFRFIEAKRQELWTAVYESTSGSLELTLHPQQPEWRLYAKPDPSEPSNSVIRRMLEIGSVGRLVCDQRFGEDLPAAAGLLDGKWDFALPLETRVKITVEGVENVDSDEMEVSDAPPALVPAWQAKLGLQGEDFKDRVVYAKLRISVPQSDQALFERNISGIYTLHDNCGTANSALHKKQAESGEEKLPPLFLLLDPSRCGDPKEDGFVFSISRRRYEFGETRPIICRLDPGWRQTTPLEKNGKKVDCFIPFKWVYSSGVALKSSQNKDSTFAVPSDKFQIDVSVGGCESANAILLCRVPLNGQAGQEWHRGTWKEVDKIHERGTFKALAWLLERIRTVDDHFAEWQNVTSNDSTHSERCERCAPTPPRIEWRKVGKKAVAVEDIVGAGEYERSLKRRPSPFVTHLKFDETEGVGTVRIGINIPSLLHRALHRLPAIKGNGRMEKRPELSWRLDTEFTPAAKIVFSKFNLRSNKEDSESSQPTSFKIPLRPEQLRSLHWMLEQEDIKRVKPFFEEEISEAIMAPLGWRAEGRARREVLIRGGVLADQVGYGKTAITLGLLDCTQKAIEKELKAKISNQGDDFIKGKIAVKASLIIVPPHLTGQWASEVKKFTGARFKIVTLSTASSLNSLTIETVEEADMVIVASNLFSSSVYLDNLQTLSGGGSLPAQDGRYFAARLDEILAGLKSHVEILRDEGSAALLKEIKAARIRHEEAQAFVPTKRLKGKSYREAVKAKENDDPKVEIVTNALSFTKVSDTKVPRIENSSLTSQFMDSVVLERRKTTKSATSASDGDTNTSNVAKSNDGSDEDSDVPRRKKRKAATKNAPIVISDEEQDVSDFEPDAEEVKAQPSGSSKRKKSGSVSSRPSKRAKPSSDEDFSAEESDEDDEEKSDAEDEVEEPSSEDERPRKKAKPVQKSKAKPRTSIKRKTSSASSNADSMDVDDSEPSATKSKERKSDDRDKRPAKKQKNREDSNPWKLGTPAVKNNWKEMRSPPLEMFHFARKVIDEYTYLEKKNHALVTRLTADRHWVLSGTPPTHDFSALKTIAAFMNVHLGVDDDGEGKVVVKKRQREQTTAERFHSFREVHSLEWHAHRQEVGQAFLDRFVRQNIAEIEEIPLTEHIEKVVLPAAERAIYLELEHHLRALEMVIKRGKKTESDREKRLAQSLGDSSTAEEALLKRCSHFDLDTSEKENAMKACEVIVEERKKQLNDCKRELSKKLTEALKSEKNIPKTSEETFFREFVRLTIDEGLGDKQATELTLELFEQAEVTKGYKGTKALESKTSTSKGKNKAKDDSGLTGREKDLLWNHREETHEIRKLTKELTGRVRSLRYFTVVRDLQRQKDEPVKVSCPSCGRTELPIEEISVLSSCGHTGCHSCIVECAKREECVYAASEGCRSPARVLNVVEGITLGVDDEARDGRGKHYGLKLEKVIDLVKNRLPPNERVLVFVQFPDLMKKVAEALSAHKIKFLEIKGSAAVKSKNLLKFQNSSDERVLLLNVMDESASGANLTVANHAIFLSPLLAPSQEIYDACEIQAVGRLRRYGQTKHVHIWRFLSTNTIDMEIFESRTHRKVV